MACCGKSSGNNLVAQGVRMAKEKNNWVLLKYVGEDIERSIAANAAGGFYLIGTSTPLFFVHPGDVDRLIRRLDITLASDEEKATFTQQTVTQEEGTDSPDMLSNLTAQEVGEPVDDEDDLETAKMASFDEDSGQEVYDFTSIKGIGEASANRMYELGYTTLASVAADGEEEFSSKMGDDYKRAPIMYKAILERYHQNN